jgi:orotate phosphoribosyltransferase-like protein
MREKARKLRREKELTIDEIAERLAVSRTTVYFWVGAAEIEQQSASISNVAFQVRRPHGPLRRHDSAHSAARVD